MTDREKWEEYRRYTEINTIESAQEGVAEEYNVFLKIDHQSFCVTPVPFDALDEAEWFRDQLAKALGNLTSRRIETLEKVQWCVCNGARTCIACLIENIVREHFGTGGLTYLRAALDAAKEGE